MIHRVELAHTIIFFSLSWDLFALFFQCILSCSRKLNLNLEFLPSLFSLSFCFVDYFLLLSIIFRISYLYLFLILFVLFSFVFLLLLPLFHVQNCLSAFWFFLPFIFPLLIHRCSDFPARFKTDVKPVSRVALFCSEPHFFFYVFVCYKLSWFINLSRLFKGVCITKQEK